MFYRNNYWVGTCLLLFVFSTAVSSAENSNYLIEKFIYDIIAEDQKVGVTSLTIEQQSDGSYIRFEKTHVEVSWLFGDINFRSNYYEKFDRNNNLVSIEGKVYDGKSAWWTQAKLVDNQVWAFMSEVKNLNQQEEEQLLGMVASLASGLVSGVGEMISVTQMLFGDRQKPNNSVRINVNEFVTTFDNLPSYWLSQEQKLPTTIRLLDTEELVVIEYEISTLENSQYNSGASSYRLKTRGDEPVQVWFALSGKGIPHFTRIEGEDETGPFVIEFKPVAGN